MRELFGGRTRVLGSPNIGPVFTIAMDISGRRGRSGDPSGSSAGVGGQGTSVSSIANKVVVQDRAVSQGGLECRGSWLRASVAPVIVFGISRKHGKVEIGIVARYLCARDETQVRRL